MVLLVDNIDNARKALSKIPGENICAPNKQLKEINDFQG